MFGWVDFSDRERERAFEMLALARQPGAIDELGLGVLRDSFANLMFPATSTLHTHARYYFFVAYLMKYLEEEYSGQEINKIRAAHANAEKNTARGLIAWCQMHGKPTNGVTGKDFVQSDRWVKQTPTMMNWSAARAYGLICDPNLKLSGFLNLVTHSAAERTGRRNHLDDGCTIPVSGLWNVPLDAYASWKSVIAAKDEADHRSREISLDLTEAEALQLRESICAKWPSSLYSAILSHPDVIQKVPISQPWTKREKAS